MLACLAMITLFACGGGGGGSSSGPAADPANMVVVTLPPPSPVGGSNWVAFQDGQGPWKVLTGTPTGPTTSQYKFQVNDPSGRYGLVVVVEFPLGNGTNGYYGMLERFTLSEVRTLDYSAWGPVTTASVAGFVSGLAPTDGARICTGSFTKNLNPGSTAAMLSARTGATDFIAVRLPGMGSADSVVARRGYLVPTTGPVDITFDFNSGWALVPQAVTATNVAPSETLSLKVDWMMPSTSIQLAGGIESPLSFNAVPASRMLPGELHALTATASDTALWTYRYAMAYSLSAANISLPLPSALSPMTFAAANVGPYYRPATTWTALPGALVHDLSFGDIYEYLDWDVHLSAEWLGTGSTLSFTFPDFTGLEGWKSAWGLPFGRDLYWNLSERQTTHVDPGFYSDGPRAFQAGNTAWESLVYGGVNVTPGVAPLGRKQTTPFPVSRQASGVSRERRAAHTRFD